ncbi:F0F1 ATP synthase subunit gamma [Hoeflea ulvae]|uniref:F0F1 ATP synthase subunit gamma n=1 Tax=Hoeflea ulvae TaxID=2983764 RepID=A0ABT3YLL8_9HYPH|nr:FoF1 ATP synthase subunit gamma [Hoeflea ulvae]MCY0096772.1 F0F1 ATP synthase subunit gamma [Hoeflea ulvae]
MAQTLDTLVRRTASIQGIRSVVHTMKTLSVINAAPYEHAALAIEAYHQTVLEGLHAFLVGAGPLGVDTSRIARRVLVVFGSDHGLCGNYNEAIAAHVRHHVDGEADGAATMLCIGAQMADALQDQGFEVEKTFLPAASVDGLERLANLLTERLDEIRRSSHPREIAVSLAYSARGEGDVPVLKIVALLPLDQALLRDLRSKPWNSRSLPSYSMPAGDLFRALVRSHLFASLFRAAADAMVTENAARLALMQQAEQSVDDRLEELKSDTRTLRQSEITTELLDVIIGFEALKKKKIPGPSPEQKPKA